MNNGIFDVIVAGKEYRYYRIEKTKSGMSVLLFGSVNIYSDLFIQYIKKNCKDKALCKGFFNCESTATKVLLNRYMRSFFMDGHKDLLPLCVCRNEDEARKILAQHAGIEVPDKKGSELKRFKVPCEWVMRAYVSIPAFSRQEAITKAAEYFSNPTVGLPKGEYLEDSFCIVDNADEVLAI